MSTSPTAPPRPYSLRKRVIGGGIIAAVVGVAIWLGSLGLGPGLGPGEGGGGGDSESEQSSNVSDEEEATVEEESRNDAEEQTISPVGQPPLHVIISGSDYLIAWHGDEDPVPATLEEIVEIAVSMPLGPEERRVLIDHTVTAESGARTDLRNALKAAGLTELQFGFTSDPVLLAPQ